jgi:hypothetical protein
LSEYINVFYILADVDVFLLHVSSRLTAYHQEVHVSIYVQSLVLLFIISIQP